MNFKTKGNFYLGQASSPESTASICVKTEVYSCLNGQFYKDSPCSVLITFYILSLSQLFPLSGPIQRGEQTMAMSLPGSTQQQWAVLERYLDLSSHSSPQSSFMLVEVKFLNKKFYKL